MSIWITLGPILAINLILFISLLVYTFTKRSREIPEAAKRHTSKMLAGHLKEWWVFTTDPIARLFVRMGVRPSTLTFIGFLFSAVAAVLFARGLFGYAGWVMILGATFDIFDGRVARLTGQESRSGAFYDSVMDRFGEGVCFLGLAFYFHASWVLFFVVAGLIGSMLVSYTRARGEAVGIVCKGGAMQRPERIVYIGVSSVFDPISSTILAHWFALPPPILVIGALVIIAVMTNATAIHRMIFIMNALDTSDKSERETIPQLLTKLSTPEGRQAVFKKAKYGYDRSRAQFAHIIHFNLDGADINIMKELIDKGEMPNLSRHILERGGSYEAVSAFPSTTGPSFTPFVTGCFPGTCNVPGARWFDRSVPSARVLTLNRFRDYLGWGAYAMDYDLSKSVRTIFEYSRRAMNIFGMVNRGCGIIRDPAFFRLHSLFKRAKRETDLSELEDVAFQWFEDAIWRDTDYVFYSFPSIDVTASDRNHEKNALFDAYRRFDSIVGRAAALLKEHGKYDETIMFVAGDHGHGELKSSFDLTRFMSNRMPTIVYPARQWLDARAIPLLSGTSMAHLYLNKNGDWEEKYLFEDIDQSGLVGALLEHPEIDIVAGRSAEGGISVVSKRGRAHLVEDADGRITYSVSTSDPFGYSGIARTGDSRSVFLSTADTGYPDGIMQVLQIFRSPRTGDLVISASKGASLEDKAQARKSAITHGSLLREHLYVPFFSSIPLKTNRMRTADTFALMLDIFGIDAEHALDGAAPEWSTEWTVESYDKKAQTT